jgi:hypothetical protein
VPFEVVTVLAGPALDLALFEAIDRPVDGALFVLLAVEGVDNDRPPDGFVVVLLAVDGVVVVLLAVDGVLRDRPPDGFVVVLLAVDGVLKERPPEEGVVAVLLAVEGVDRDRPPDGFVVVLLAVDGVLNERPPLCVLFVLLGTLAVLPVGAVFVRAGGAVAVLCGAGAAGFAAGAAAFGGGAAGLDGGGGVGFLVCAQTNPGRISRISNAAQVLRVFFLSSVQFIGTSTLLNSFRQHSQKC